VVKRVHRPGYVRRLLDCRQPFPAELTASS
jgi:hypothetical protein